MKKLLTFPTWLTVRLLNVFLPKNHEWKNKKFSLKDWSENSTELNDFISFYFWINGIALLILILVIIMKLN